MAKAKALHVQIGTEDPYVVGEIKTALTEVHGAHGLRINQLDNETADSEYALVVNEPEEGRLAFSYRAHAGESPVVEESERDSYQIARAISRFVLSRLAISDQELSSDVQQHAELARHRGEKPSIDTDPSKWIFENPLMTDLCRRYPKYGNLIRYLCNERGLFLKAGNYPMQRAYWNSTLNGGLPIYKKSDPIHEGTFMLHDLFHFVPIDPVIGTNKLDSSDKGFYVAHRLLSESTTLVLADMVAVDDAELESQGYDVAKRKIYPVYRSIIQNTGRKPDQDRLLAANAYFCFTGDPEGFLLMGASPEVVDDYKEKYRSVFTNDFLWNLNNFEAMQQERDSNPLVQEYYQWLHTSTHIPSLEIYNDPSFSDSTGINIAEMLSVFRADVNSALTYRGDLDDFKRAKLGHQKYLAGQRLAFARFGNEVDAGSKQEEFDDLFKGVAAAESAADLQQQVDLANQLIDQYVAELYNRDILLPHELKMNVFSVPLYPVRFINYEKQRSCSFDLAEEINKFIFLNKGQLHRLLEVCGS